MKFIRLFSLQGLSTPRSSDTVEVSTLIKCHEGKFDAMNAVSQLTAEISGEKGEIYGWSGIGAYPDGHMDGHMVFVRQPVKVSAPSFVMVGDTPWAWVPSSSREVNFYEESKASSGHWSSGPEARDLRIDQEIELVPNLNVPATYKLASEYGCLKINGTETCPDQQALSKAFERSFGSKPVGQVSATATRLANPNHKPHSRPDDVRSGTGPLEIEFSDDLGIHLTRIVLGEKIAQKDETAPLFNGQHGNHYRSFGASFLGYVENGQSQQIPVIVNYNMGDALTVVDLSGGGTNHPLLTSLPVWYQ